MRSAVGSVRLFYCFRELSKRPPLKKKKKLPRNKPIARTLSDKEKKIDKNEMKRNRSLRVSIRIPLFGKGFIKTYTARVHE